VYVKFFGKQEFLNTNIFHFQFPCRNRSVDSSISVSTRLKAERLRDRVSNPDKGEKFSSS
jgi:hypothetical protein